MPPSFHFDIEYEQDVPCKLTKHVRFEDRDTFAPINESLASALGQNFLSCRLPLMGLDDLGKALQQPTDFLQLARAK